MATSYKGCTRLAYKLEILFILLIRSPTFGNTNKLKILTSSAITPKYVFKDVLQLKILTLKSTQTGTYLGSSSQGLPVCGSSALHSGRSCWSLLASLFSCA